MTYKLVNNTDSITKKMAGIVVNTTNSRGGTGYITDILIDSEL